MNVGDEFWMARAVELSRRGLPSPNPRVGCVLVRNGLPLSEGWHDHAGGPHAEAVALAAAGQDAIGATAYVTMEPCNHFGRTPPCSEALIRAGIVRVVFAVDDPNPVASGGRQALAAAGILVESGLMESAARQVNALWLDFQITRRPRVILKAAVSADGFMAGLPGSPRVQITGPSAQAHGRRLRCEAGAVLVGSGTVRTDHPLLTARIPEAVNDPIRVILDSRAVLDPEEPALQGPEAIWIVGQGRARLERQVEAPLDQGGRIAPEAVLAEMARRGIPGLLVEGGPTIHRSFLGLADEIVLYQSPEPLGEGRLWPGPTPQTAGDLGWKVAEFDRFGPDGFWRLIR